MYYNTSSYWQLFTLTQNYQIYESGDLQKQQ